MSYKVFWRMAVAFLFSASAFAQLVTVGARLSFAGNANPAETTTFVVGGQAFRATLDGDVTSATFGWSAGPCASAVKIKFFRPRIVGGATVSYDFLAERGPFDVGAPTGGPPPAVVQTVALDPPVSLLGGDVIAMTNLVPNTLPYILPCGGPTYQNLPGPIPPQPPSVFLVPGDVMTSVDAQPFTRQAVFVIATGPSQALGLLFNRFAVTMTALNPRTLATAVGVPNRIEDDGRHAAGFFSLPTFTGDSAFPEVIVKLTAPSSPGGSYWFFYSALTDVRYSLTVTDQLRGMTRRYDSTGPFCGGADTSAFPP